MLSMLSETAQSASSQPSLLGPAIVFAIGSTLTVITNIITAVVTYKLGTKQVTAAEHQAEATVRAVKEQVRGQEEVKGKELGFERDKLSDQRKAAVADVWREHRRQAHVALLAEMRYTCSQVGNLAPEVATNPGGWDRRKAQEIREAKSRGLNDSLADVLLVASEEAGSAAQTALARLGSWIDRCALDIRQPGDGEETAYRIFVNDRNEFSILYDAYRAAARRDLEIDLLD